MTDANRIPDKQLTLVLTGKPNRIQSLQQRYKTHADQARILALPLLETSSIYQPDHPVILKLIDLIKNCKYLIGAAFSTSGVQALAEIHAQHSNLIPGKLPWCAVGKRTALELESKLQSAPVFLLAPDNTGAGLAGALIQRIQAGEIPLQPFPEANPEILAIAAERGRPEFFEIMQAAGIKVHHFELYKTKARIPTASELKELPAGAWICFGSPSAVAAFFKADLPAKHSFRYASIGPTTSQALASLGQPVDYQARSADYGQLMEELIQKAQS